MLLSNQPCTLLISRDPVLLAAMEPVLLAAGLRVSIELSPQSALDHVAPPEQPCLIFYDIEIAGADGESSFCQWLADARAAFDGHKIPIVLISDTVHEDWYRCLTEGALDDLIPRSAESALWRLRLSMVLRSCHRMREVERLRESTAIDARIDRLTGVCNRATLLSMLFRETDRVQRMRTQLSVILFDLDHFGEWNSHLGFAVCDDLLCQVVGRAMRLLRSYDILGRTGNDEFLLILPGCGIADAQMLSERLRADVFGSPFLTANKSVQLTACFGIAPSLGRSPIVVLRAAEEALAQAVQEGNESIRCSGCDQRGEDATVSFLSPGSGEGTLSW